MKHLTENATFSATEDIGHNLETDENGSYAKWETGASSGISGDTA